MIQDGRRIVDKIFARVLRGRPARFSRAAVIVRDDRVVERKFRHLKRGPDIAGASGFAEKKNERAATVNFVVDLDAIVSDKRHMGLSQLLIRLTTRTRKRQSKIDRLHS